MAAIKEAHKMDYIMETVGLRKAYKDNIVVDDVNMHISKGQENPIKQYNTKLKRHGELIEMLLFF